MVWTGGVCRGIKVGFVWEATWEVVEVFRSGLVLPSSIALSLDAAGTCLLCWSGVFSNTADTSCSDIP